MCAASIKLELEEVKLKKLEDTNNYILRSLLGYGHTPYNYLLNMAGIRMLKERRKFQALVLVYKCIHKEAPRYIEEFFQIKICNYNLRESGTLLTLPSFNLEWCHISHSHFWQQNFGICYLHMLETPRIFLLLNVF